MRSRNWRRSLGRVVVSCCLCGLWNWRRSFVQVGAGAVCESIPQMVGVVSIYRRPQAKNRGGATTRLRAGEASHGAVGGGARDDGAEGQGGEAGTRIQAAGGGGTPGRPMILAEFWKQSYYTRRLLLGLRSSPRRIATISGLPHDESRTTSPRPRLTSITTVSRTTSTRPRPTPV